MNVKGSKFERFAAWSPVKSNDSDRQYAVEDGFAMQKAGRAIKGVLDGIRRGWETGSERIKGLKKSLRSYSGNTAQPAAEEPVTRKKILHPQGAFLQRWTKIFVLACVIAVSVDPLFFYIPVLDPALNCLDLDTKLEIIACVLRTFIDVFYVLRIVFQFRTGFIAPSSRVFGRGVLVDDPRIIARRYLTQYFFIDVLSILPLPQVVILFILPKLHGPVSLTVKNLLKYIIICQYVPRFMRIYPLYKEVTTASGILTETAWAGAVFNLFLYMLASHVIGSLWYLFSIETKERCWHKACKEHACGSSVFCCHHKLTPNISLLNESCLLIKPDDIQNSSVFNFGMFFDALESGVVYQSKNFSTEILILLLVGSLGQNLQTSTFAVETLFAIFISIAGLVLFALLIGNMQKYLQSTTVRIEEMRVKKRDVEQWMSHRMLPENLKDRIRRYEQYRWQETRGVEERALIHNFPKDLRRDINRHLSLDLLTRVPMFEKMDEKILDAVCDRLRPALYTKGSYIVREGDPVDEMLFIMRGNLKSETTNGGRTGFFNVVYLKAGDFCGEGLLTWALDPQSSSNLPISTRTVRAVNDVEAFALVSEDLKSVASQFRRLHHKDIQHTFRFCSVQWRTWAACFIQAAWRCHWKRKQAKSLLQAQDKLQDALANEAAVGASPSLGVAVYVSQFAANALRNLRQNGARPARLPPRRLALLPQKPAEPDFSTHH